ncbi:MAG: glycosyltransferase [Nanoarchaeota archaeon]|nr:glycosyltransferase [Nanoarchaeota archaeon]
MDEEFALISPIFPSSGGVATYTKYLFDEEIKINKNIVVLADKLSIKLDENKNINRCWDKNLKFPYQLSKEIIKRKIKKIHIQQEMHIFGSKITAFILPFFILFLRSIKREITVTLHGVVPLNEVDKDFLKENGYSGNPVLIKLVLKILYSLICLFSSKIIVHEKKFKDYLKDYWVDIDKVYVIGHGIKSKDNLLSKKISRERLGLQDKYTFLYFGYVTGYKGIELLMDALKKIKYNDFNLIFVGSVHPRLKDEPKYKDYYNNIKDFISNDKRCIFSGYVDEKDIDYYFRAADCSIFPYTVQMSSSGPMALAIANENLIIASESFNSVVLKKLIFKRNPDSLIDLMKQAKTGKLNSEIKEIANMKKRLSWTNIAKKTLGVINK